MKTIKNPAAFPLKHLDDNFNPGMTLRDYFAGQAIIGILSNASVWNEIQTLRESAKFAYEISEELLKERDESKDNR